MQLSSLIGKKIVSPAGEQLGYVTGAYLSRDLKTLTALSAVDGDEEDFILPVRAIRACSDAIIASKIRVTAPPGVSAPIGVRAFSEKGDDLGVVGDWLFGDCEPAFILVKDGVRTGYPAEAVASEESVIVYLSGARPAPKKRALKKAVKTASTENEDTMSDPIPSQNLPYDEKTEGEETHSEAKPQEEPTEERTQAAEQTFKYELGGRNLLGRRVMRSVFDAQGEIVALAGDRITPEVLSRARKKGRLLALTVNTLTNVY